MGYVRFYDQTLLSVRVVAVIYTRELTASSGAFRTGSFSSMDFADTALPVAGLQVCFSWTRILSLFLAPGANYKHRRISCLRVVMWVMWFH